MRSRRYYERQIDKLLAIIEKQNDRIMYLAGRTWGDPPTSLEATQRSLDQMLDTRLDYSYAPEEFPDEELVT